MRKSVVALSSRSLHWRACHLSAHKARISQEVLIEKYFKQRLESKHTPYFHKDGEVPDERTIETLQTYNWALDAAFKIPKEAVEYGEKLLISDIQGPDSCWNNSLPSLPV